MTLDKLTTFWLHSDYILTSFWLQFGYSLATFWLFLTTFLLHSGYISATFQLHFGYILARFWLHSGFNLTTFYLYSDYTLTIVWVHSGYFLATFWLHSDYILTTFWLHSGYILTTFWLHSGYRLTERTTALLAVYGHFSYMHDPSIHTYDLCWQKRRPLSIETMKDFWPYIEILFMAVFTTLRIQTKRLVILCMIWLKSYSLELLKQSLTTTSLFHHLNIPVTTMTGNTVNPGRRYIPFNSTSTTLY